MRQQYNSLIDEKQAKFFKYLENRSFKAPATVDDAYRKYSAYVGHVGDNANMAGQRMMQSNFLKYREMSTYPEIAYATDILMSKFSDVRMFLQLEDKHIANTAKICFDMTKNLILPIKEVVDLQFIIDGKVFIRKVMNNKGTGIEKLQVLDPLTTDFEVDDDNEIKYFTVNKTKKLMPSEVIYINWGQYGMSPKHIRGYYDAAVRVYEQLRSLEDNWVNLAQMRTKNWVIWNFHSSETDQAIIENNVNAFLQSMRHRNSYNAASGGIQQQPDSPDVIRHVGFIKDDFGHHVSHEKVTFDIDRPDTSDAEFLLNKLWVALRVPAMLRTGQDARNYISVDEIRMQEQFYNTFVSSKAERLMHLWNTILWDILSLKLDKADTFDFSKNTVYCFPNELETTNDFMDLSITAKYKEAEAQKLEHEIAIKKLEWQLLQDPAKVDDEGGAAGEDSLF